MKKVISNRTRRGHALGTALGTILALVLLAGSAGATGEAWAWGWNTYGNLGDGTNTQSAIPVQVSNATGLTDAIEIDGGYGHTVALENDGTVWTWGWNIYGQLGDGTTINKNTPVNVSYINSGFLDVIDVAAGESHTAAIRSDGTVWTWGANNYYQLGRNPLTAQDGYIPGMVSGLSGVRDIAAGFDFTVALKNDGTVWTWGWNDWGELGDGTNNYKSIPVQVKDTNDPTGNLTGVTAVAAGRNHAAALKNDGTVRTWGRNTDGQLGDGTITNRNTSVQVVESQFIPALTGVSKIAVGNYHTLALKSDGTVWTWGSNNYGQLGIGITTSRNIPAQMSALTGITGFTDIEAGDSYTVALMSNGTVWTWGYNNFGQLGDGTTTSKYNPVKVSSLPDVTDVAAAAQHTLALKGSQLPPPPPQPSSTVGYSAIVPSGQQNTFIQSSNGNFGTIRRGESGTILNSVVLNNTGDANAVVDARFSTGNGTLFGLVSGSDVLGAGNFYLGTASIPDWIRLSDGGSNVQVATAPYGGETALDAKLYVPLNQAGGSYSGTVVLTFGNQ